MGVDHILKVLAQAHIEWIQVAFTLHDLEQAIELIDRQVFNDSLWHGSDFFLRWRPTQRLVDKVSVYLLQRRVTSIYQISQVLDWWRLVLNQNEQEVKR